MKTYRQAKVRITHIESDIIATSVSVHNEPGAGHQLAPTHKSLWE